MVLDRISVLRNIVGMQPITAPVGLVFHLSYSDSPESPDKMQLNIEKYAVEAASRKLSASYAIEAMQDLQALHGTDITDVLEAALCGEIANEIIAEVLTDILKGATVDTSHVHNAIDILPTYIKIQQAAIKIAKDTKRGAGNIIITDLETCTSLLKSGKVDKVADVALDEYSVLKFFGTMDNDRVKLFYTSLPQYAGKAVIGYKSPFNNIDCGYIFSPYLPVYATPMVQGPHDFEVRMGFITRYAKFAITDRAVEGAHPILPCYAVIDVQS